MNPEVLRKRKVIPTSYNVKSLVNCRKCYSQISNPHGLGSLDCPDCGQRIDCRLKTTKMTPERLTKFKNWCAVPDNKQKHKKNWQTRERMVILKKVGRGKIECSNCGCSDVRILEINHINGGGTLETRKGRYAREFHWAIYKGTRSIDDLNLLCKVCNIEHYVKLKFGIDKFKITYVNS